MRNCTRWGFLAMLALTMSLRAQDQATPQVAAKKREPARAPKTNVTAKAVTPKALTSTTISEVVAQNIMLPAGMMQQFFAQSDFSGADKVNIGIYATPDQDLTNTTYLVWWAFSAAPYYVSADVIQGKSFNFANTGGASVSPYGNLLLITVENNGTAPVTISQITAYAVAR